MHQLLMLAIVAGLTFATAGHSKTFAASYGAAARGEVLTAVDLFTTGIWHSLSDAGEQERRRKSRREQYQASSW